MSHDDQVFLKLGREIVRMIGELDAVAGKDAGYIRRKLTYRGAGSVELFLVKSAALADGLEAAVAAEFDVADITPPSQRN